VPARSNVVAVAAPGYLVDMALRSLSGSRRRRARRVRCPGRVVALAGVLGLLLGSGRVQSPARAEDRPEAEGSPPAEAVASRSALPPVADRLRGRLERARALAAQMGPPAGAGAVDAEDGVEALLAQAEHALRRLTRRPAPSPAVLGGWVDLAQASLTLVERRLALRRERAAADASQRLAAEEDAQAEALQRAVKDALRRRASGGRGIGIASVPPPPAPEEAEDEEAPE